MDLPAFSYRTWPFYWLARASGRYLQNMEKELRESGLELTQWRVLMTLHEEKHLSVSEIADHSISKLSTMTRIVQRMQADGLVDCKPRAEDARVTEVSLTEAGSEASVKAWQAAATVYERAFRRMSKRDMETLNSLLMKLAGNLQADAE